MTIFFLRIQQFSLFHEILQLDQLEGADFKYGNSFLKFQLKISQIRHFLSQIEAFFLQNFQLDKFEGADFKYDNIFLKFLPKNTQIRYFWSQVCNQTNSRVLISNMTMLFSNSSPKIPKSRIFGPRFKDFQFCVKLGNKINSRTLIPNRTIFFHMPVEKYPNKAFLIPNLGIFLFSQNFATRKVPGC